MTAMEQLSKKPNAEQAEIQALFDEVMDESKPSKTFAQLLAENPHHKGGLAQLASAEAQALSRSTEDQRLRFQQSISGSKA